MARTKLMKLLFLIDRELHRRYGAAVFRWKMYRYGPFSREVLDVLDDMEVYGSVVAKVTDDAIIYELASTAPAELPQEVKEVADQILEAWARRSLDELLTCTAAWAHGPHQAHEASVPHRQGVTSEVWRYGVPLEDV
jgi:hypothetical protein